jgi:hypothetical protein
MPDLKSRVTRFAPSAADFPDDECCRTPSAILDLSYIVELRRTVQRHAPNKILASQLKPNDSLDLCSLNMTHLEIQRPRARSRERLALTNKPVEDTTCQLVDLAETFERSENGWKP